MFSMFCTYKQTSLLQEFPFLSHKKTQHGKNLEKLQERAIFRGAFQDCPGELVTSKKMWGNL